LNKYFQMHPGIAVRFVGPDANHHAPVLLTVPGLTSTPAEPLQTHQHLPRAHALCASYI
jgi:hypothetical protein